MKMPFPPPLPEAGRRFDVVGFGGNALDTILRLPRFPAPGDKVKFVSYDQQGGGRGATPMVALARLGFRTRYIGGVANDAEGRLLLDGLRAEGVDVAEVLVRPGGLTQRAVVLVDDATGERTILWGRSEGMPIAPDEVRPKAVTTGRIFYTDGQDPRSAAIAARHARAAGMPVLADIEDVRPGLEDLLPEIDLLVVSAEFPRLAADTDDLDRASAALEERTGGAWVIVTLGARGAIARVDGSLRSYPAYAVAAVDTTGAGDVFHAGLAAACLRRMPLPDAIDFAHAMAAMKCLRPGGREGLPHSFEEIERFRRATPHRAAV